MSDNTIASFIAGIFVFIIAITFAAFFTLPEFGKDYGPQIVGGLIAGIMTIFAGWLAFSATQKSTSLLFHETRRDNIIKNIGDIFELFHMLSDTASKIGDAEHLITTTYHCDVSRFYSFYKNGETRDNVEEAVIRITKAAIDNIANADKKFELFARMLSINTYEELLMEFFTIVYLDEGYMVLAERNDSNRNQIDQSIKFLFKQEECDRPCLFVELKNCVSAAYNQVKERSDDFKDMLNESTEHILNPAPYR